MRPRLLVVLFSLLFLTLIAGVSYLSRSGEYVEFAPVDVAVQVAPAASAAPAAAPVSLAAAGVAAPVSPMTAATSAVPAVTLSGVSSLLADVSHATSPKSSAAAPSAPMAANAQPAAPTPVNASKNARLAGASSQWRRASTVSKAEIEAAVVRDEMTPETAVAFRSACGHDHDLHFDAKGRPLYSCNMKIQVGPDTTPITSTPSYALEDTFKLHSRPTATRKIYLDFNGHVTPAGIWNDDTDPDLVNPPWSIDGSPDFSDAEKAVVQETFRRVAEHFAPWNVDVTTEDPGVESLRKTSLGDLNYGIRVVIGPVDGEAGGVAHLNSFSSSEDDPCFVYTLSGFPASVIAGIASHEVGHTVSLLHQGNLNGADPISKEYFGGHGSGALSWSPIMGNGIRPVNQWAKGEYEGANRTQDNLVAIANTNSGIPLLVDDHGDTRSAATFAPGLSVTAGGVIGSTTDVDMIRINAGRGNLFITPKVSLVGPNLRLQVRVLNDTGAVLGTYVGAGTAGNMAPALITVVIPKDGMYYIELDGIGNGDGVTEGYTGYGSIGFYSLTASWVAPGNKPPVAVTTGTAPLTYDYTDSSKTVNFTGLLSTDSDGIITNWSWNFNDVYPSSATGALVSHRYKAPGVYRPVLTVTDDLGATGSATVTVTVTGTPLPNTCSLATTSSAFIRVNSIADAATATIQVQDQYGNPLRRAVVAVAVSGLVSSPKIQVRTDIMGNVTVVSPKFKRGARGTVTFTVTTVTSTTHKYVSADNDCPVSVSKTR